MDVMTLEWYRTDPASVPYSFADVEIHMGLCASDQLVGDFDENFVPGTKTLVLQVDTLVFDAGPDEWFGVTLDAPYHYGGEQNLIIEIFHNPGEGYAYSLAWPAGTARCISAWSQPGQLGYPRSIVPYMRLTGVVSLVPITFGAIKAVFAAPD